MIRKMPELGAQYAGVLGVSVEPLDVADAIFRLCLSRIAPTKADTMGAISFINEAHFPSTIRLELP